MRTILLALLTVLVLAPQAADAARRDERSGTAVSRTNTAASPATRASTRATPRTTTRAAATPTRAAARTTTARAAPRTASRAATRTTTRATAARNTSRNAARTTRSQANNRQATIRRGDVRTQRAGVVVRGASAATISRRSGIAGWQAGLPAMTMTQRDCPAGTFAILARGHDDIVRCMPL